MTGSGESELFLLVLESEHQRRGLGTENTL